MGVTGGVDWFTAAGAVIEMLSLTTLAGAGVGAITGGGVEISGALATGTAAAGHQLPSAATGHAGNNEENKGSKIAPTKAASHVRCRMAADDLRSIRTSKAANTNNNALFSAASAIPGQLTADVK